MTSRGRGNPPDPDESPHDRRNQSEADYGLSGLLIDT